MTMTIIGIALCMIAGLLHGIREAYHADAFIFVNKFGAKPGGFWSGYSWKNKYKDYDGGDLRPKYPWSFWLPWDFWHLAARLTSIFLIAGIGLVVCYSVFYMILVAYLAMGVGSYTGYIYVRKIK